ncbi:tetratricopeptide repeat protein, partial [Streptomyces sp. NPDC051578]|uniref:tetratricopeptide repeat protein n=1 Tax=Streptomyces sp. NPDC051578 TaxID=3365662 RepID=UPI00379214E6
QAAARFAELGDHDGEGRALNNLGTALQQVRRFNEAIDAHQQAAARFAELGDHDGEGRALNNLGTALQQVRRFDEAIDAHQQAAARFTELGDHEGEGRALNNLGMALQQVRRFDEAIDAHQQAAARFAEMSDDEGRVLNNLGTALQSRGLWRVRKGKSQSEAKGQSDPRSDAGSDAKVRPERLVPLIVDFPSGSSAVSSPAPTTVSSSPEPPAKTEVLTLTAVDESSSAQADLQMAGKRWGRRRKSQDPVLSEDR